MERFAYYLEIVPLYVLFGMPVLLLFVMMMTPPRLRLGASLVLMVIWLTLGRLPDLGFIQAVTKSTLTGSFLLVITAAYLHPGPKRMLPPIVWLYPVMAVISVIYVLRVEDRTLAIVLRFNWLLLVIAAIRVAKTIVDSHSLHYVIRSLCVGLMLGLLVPFSALVRNPHEAFGGGFHRFSPFGANPNIIGTLFLLSAPICVYLFFHDKARVWRFLLIGFGALAVALGLLTSSRSVIFLMAIPIAAVIMKEMRRPILMLVAGGILSIVIWWILGLTGSETRFSRLGNLETSRGEIRLEYSRIIARRPIFGLMMASNESYLISNEIGAHPHNVYVETLYLGGISYALPMFFLMFRAAYGTLRIWWRRKQIWIAPLTANLLAGLMATFFLHGIVNGSIMYPTYAWAFAHILFSLLAITWSADIGMTAHHH